MAGGSGLCQQRPESCGRYLTTQSQNHSFHTNPPKSWDSWKRFLRAGTGNDSSRRTLLKQLWDRIDPGIDLAQQLDQVINTATNLEPWRHAMVLHPGVIDYCEQREIRWYSPERIYLLKKRQMNGSHAELFSYVLYLELCDDTLRQQLAPLEVQGYASVRMTEVEPHIHFTFNHPHGSVYFSLETANGRFRLYAARDQLQKPPGILATLKEKSGLLETETSMERTVSRDAVLAALLQLATALGSMASSAIPA